MTEAQARRELLEAGRRLLREGLVARTWGNLSLRLGRTAMAITPSGIPYLDLKPEMIVVVDLETGEWGGGWKPSGERKVHREIYRRRPQVGAIAHTHQSAASVCAASRVPVPSPWGATSCAAYRLPGTDALARATVDALGEGPAVLLANHGAITVGGTMDEAFERIKILETACETTIAEKARSALPARIDAPWDPAWLSPLVLEDGAPAFLGTAPFTVLWAKRGLPLRAVLDDLAQLVGKRVDAALRMPNRRPKNDALFVRDKGLLVTGADAEALAMVVEKAARAVVGGEALGGAKEIPTWEASLMRLVYERSYAKRAAGAKALSPSSEG